MELRIDENGKCEQSKGQCYLAAWAMLQALSKYGEHVELCHGVVTQSVPPHNKMGHAWIEQHQNGQWWVRDGLYPNRPVARDLYYRMGNITGQDVKRYTRTQARDFGRETGNLFGPWDEMVSAAVHANN